MEFKTLTGVTQKEILDVFNLSFSDYFVPFKLTLEQLATKMVADNVDLNLSVGVFDHKKLIAFILHGFSDIDGQKILYNGGTGVIPTHRGQALTQRMYEFILPMIKEKQIEMLMLEVISQNIQAIKSYQRVGYTRVRSLACYRGTLKDLPINNELEIKKIEQYDWKKMQSFWDVTPTAQNSIRAINELNSMLLCWGGFLNNQLVGYVIYNPITKRLPQMAIHKAFRGRRIAATLLQHLRSKFDPSLVVINVDKRNQPINDFFEKVGLECFLEQMEMKREMKDL